MEVLTFMTFKIIGYSNFYIKDIFIHKRYSP